MCIIHVPEQVFLFICNLNHLLSIFEALVIYINFFFMFVTEGHKGNLFIATCIQSNLFKVFIIKGNMH